MTTALRGRPRSTEADAAIRAAAIDLLTEEGYDGLTMAGVASVAGVSTATLYRRWRSKDELVAGVLFEAAEESPIPDTGSLREDCRIIVRQLVSSKSTKSAGRLLAGLVSEMSRNPALAEAMRATVVAPRRVSMRAMLQRARERGELAEDLDLDIAIDLLIGPVHHRLLVTGQPLTPRVADRLADLVVRAISPGASE